MYKFDRFDRLELMIRKHTVYLEFKDVIITLYMYKTLCFWVNSKNLELYHIKRSGYFWFDTPCTYA